MNITRDNYETFFLLYTDNELSVAERKVVDNFVHSNLDLEEELMMLQQSVCKPDTVLFDGKPQLFKSESGASLLQEKLLCYLDKEVSIHESNEINQQLKEDVALQQEWALLQHTKLFPENIIFSNKASLYRKEGGKIIAFPWKRLAIAAALTGVAAWGLVNMLNKEGNGNKGRTLVENTTAPTRIIVTPEKITHPTINHQPSTINQELSDALLATTQQQGNASATTPVATNVTKIQAPIKVKEESNNEKAPMVAALPHRNNNKVISSENLNINGSNNTITANVKPPKQPVTNGNNDIGITSIEQGPANVYVSTAAFIESGEENNNRVLFMDEERIKKTKLGGIFKKVKRVFERNTNINTGGNHLKVANLEFAIQ